MEPGPTVSVIIPTYNRRASLLRALESLSQQTFPGDRLSVIVVDDGSTDDSQSLAGRRYPFSLRWLRQKNQGATAARNRGAAASQADILVFIDDDVSISPQALEALVTLCWQSARVLAVGTLFRRGSADESVYTATMLAYWGRPAAGRGDSDLHFIDCNTELLACRRGDFFDLGMFQDPTGGHGWPNWDDVDFGYRAYRSGFRLLQSGRALGEHWDYSIGNRVLACQRWYRASRSAVWMFQRHSELQTLIPMLCDKTPLAWGKDSPDLLARKLVRSIAASSPVLAGMEKLAGLLEAHYPSPALLRRLYHWLHGAYMFRGYREGLREFALARGGRA